MNTILVTGSAGRVGSRVARQLLDKGHRVTGFDLRASGIDHPTYHEVLGGFDDRAAARQAVQGAEAILHLGAFMSWLPADRDRLFTANVEGTRVLLEEAAAVKPKRLVFASSGEVYPENVPDYQPIDEDHPLKPRSPYGLSKLLGEEIVRFFERTSGTPATILRFSHTQDASELLDPGSFFSGPRFFLQPKIRQQEGFGNAAAVAKLREIDDGAEALVLSRNEAGRPFRMHITDSRDMVAGILLALSDERAAGRTYNLGATQPVDFAVALPMMAQLTGLPLKTIDLPGAGVFYETSNARIRTELGYEPQWTFERMIGEAAQARVKRAS
ncbi:NAD(P)-dependent oxidoreductase [Bosea sp. (in: a-proteobacteria)]|jgi:UDP-glucose 4-epimerase|uniref:NAD-dependent epimerase/dehydratase family protein n=1 Tax=Bosea sp. (in: a-proteobacteria) TaxID=1871050 RepID=UPI002DDD24A7|nr:NAD(P)-dependent oxidoreductase [Bosea sp. (in: a-proteobacteria)]HEV2507933.1 NAD(P)-dependent oxidoreductase [Bosea sp. (in: a-proteobacteria)]